MLDRKISGHVRRREWLENARFPILSRLCLIPPERLTPDLDTNHSSRLPER